jgi:hypothetical protein
LEDSSLLYVNSEGGPICHVVEFEGVLPLIPVFADLTLPEFSVAWAEAEDACIVIVSLTSPVAASDTLS